MNKLFIVLLITLFSVGVMASTPLSLEEYRVIYPAATQDEYINYYNTVSGTGVYDDSVNTGVGSFNGDLTNSLNSLTGDANINLNKTETHDGGFNDTQTINQNTKTEQVIKSTPNVALTNLTTSGVDTCFGSATGGISLAGIGLSGGTTLIDENCVRLKNAKILSTLGLTDAAVALIALDPSVAKAISIAYPQLYSRLVLGEQPEQESKEVIIEEEIGSSKSWKDNPNDLYNIIFK